MPGLIDLGEITSGLLGLLSAVSPYPVGDGIAPPEAGWLEGTPNSASGFEPYLVLSGLTTGALSPAALTPLCSTYAQRFDMSYRFVGYGSSRQMADDVAAMGRELLDELDPAALALTGMIVSQLWFDAATGASRDDSAYPPMWASATTFRVSVAIKR